MVRVNGKASAALLTNMYPDAVSRQDVLHLHINAPDSESIWWETDDLLDIEVDWRRELGGVRYGSQRGLMNILTSCSAQGRFRADTQAQLGTGSMSVALHSIGTLRPWTATT
jgi:hypothetical protein